MEMKTLAPPLPLFLSLPVSLLALPNTDELSPSLPPFYYSDTLTHYLFHTLFLPPVLSHLSPLFSPGTSMCFSLIEMHFNVVQISFLQLRSKLATCPHVCVRARACDPYPVRVPLCARVRGKQAKSIPTVESATSVGLHKPPSDASLTRKLTVLVRNK